jgi:hypothetical protein
MFFDLLADTFNKHWIYLFVCVYQRHLPAKIFIGICTLRYGKSIGVIEGDVVEYNVVLLATWLYFSQQVGIIVAHFNKERLEIHLVSCHSYVNSKRMPLPLQIHAQKNRQIPAQ